MLGSTGIVISRDCFGVSSFHISCQEAHAKLEPRFIKAAEVMATKSTKPKLTPAPNNLPNLAKKLPFRLTFTEISRTCLLSSSRFMVVLLVVVEGFKALISSTRFRTGRFDLYVLSKYWAKTGCFGIGSHRFFRNIFQFFLNKRLERGYFLEFAPGHAELEAFDYGPETK